MFMHKNVYCILIIFCKLLLMIKNNFCVNNYFREKQSSWCCTHAYLIIHVALCLHVHISRTERPEMEVVLFVGPPCCVSVQELHFYLTILITNCRAKLNSANDSNMTLWLWIECSMMIRRWTYIYWFKKLCPYWRRCLCMM